MGEGNGPPLWVVQMAPIVPHKHGCSPSTQPTMHASLHLACATAERCEAGVMVWKAAKKSRRSTRT